MAETKDKGEQVSVRLEPELRAAIELAAEREHRSLSGQIRHLVATAFERQQEGIACSRFKFAACLKAD